MRILITVFMLVLVAESKNAFATKALNPKPEKALKKSRMIKTFDKYGGWIIDLDKKKVRYNPYKYSYPWFGKLIDKKVPKTCLDNHGELKFNIRTNRDFVKCLGKHTARNIGSDPRNLARIWQDSIERARSKITKVASSLDPSKVEFYLEKMQRYLLKMEAEQAEVHLAGQSVNKVNYAAHIKKVRRKAEEKRQARRKALAAMKKVPCPHCHGKGYHMGSETNVRKYSPLYEYKNGLIIKKTSSVKITKGRYLGMCSKCNGKGFLVKTKGK